MQSSDSTQSSSPARPRRRLWLPFVLVPFAAFFAIGARFGWWFIEKDAGRTLRDTGRIVEQRDLIEAALMYGLMAGLAGAFIGILVYGLYIVAKRSKRI